MNDELREQDSELSHRLTELLSAIEMFDEQMRILRESKLLAESEARAIFEQLSENTAMQQFTTGTYRIRYATEVTVSDPERLHQLYPDVVEVVTSVAYKPNKARLRVLLESPAAAELQGLAKIERVVVVERDARKSVRSLPK